MAMIRLGVVVLDCPDPTALAGFYASVLEGRVEGEGDWVEVVLPEGGPRLGFQMSAGYVPPRWPSTEHGQQLHLDFHLPRARLEDAERRVLERGAKLVEGDGGGQRDFRVYTDPVGHPFCLCVY